MNKKQNYFGFNPELFNKTATHIYKGVKVRVYKSYDDTGCATILAHIFNGVKVRVYKSYDETGCAKILEGPNKGKVTTVYFDKAKVL